MKPVLPIDAYVNILILEGKHVSITRLIRLKLIGTRLPKPHKLPGLILLLCWSYMSFATEVVMVVNKDRVVIGADSKIVVNEKKSFNRCKIRQTENSFWAGIGPDFDTEIGFSIDDVFAKFKKRHFGAVHLLDSVGVPMRSLLQKELPQLKKNSPVMYSRMVQNKFILILYCISNQDGMLTAADKGFSLVDVKVIIRPTINIIPDDVSDYDLRHEPYIKSHSYLWVGDDDLVRFGIDQLLQMGTDEDPVDVGPPFSILVLRISGAKWLRQNDCRDVQVNSEPAQKKHR